MWKLLSRECAKKRHKDVGLSKTISFDNASYKCPLMKEQQNPVDEKKLSSQERRVWASKLCTFIFAFSPVENWQ